MSFWYSIIFSNLSVNFACIYFLCSHNLIPLTELRVEVLKSSFSTKLGGYNLDILLRDYLAKKFDDLHQKGGKSVTTNPRAMGKL